MLAAARSGLEGETVSAPRIELASSGAVGHAHHLLGNFPSRLRRGPQIPYRIVGISQSAVRSPTCDRFVNRQAHKQRRKSALEPRDGPLAAAPNATSRRCRSYVDAAMPIGGHKGEVLQMCLSRLLIKKVSARILPRRVVKLALIVILSPSPGPLCPDATVGRLMAGSSLIGAMHSSASEARTPDGPLGGIDRHQSARCDPTPRAAARCGSLCPPPPSQRLHRRRGPAGQPVLCRVGDCGPRLRPRLVR